MELLFIFNASERFLQIHLNSYLFMNPFPTLIYKHVKTDLNSYQLLNFKFQTTDNI